MLPSGSRTYAQIGGRLETPVRLLLIDADPGARAGILASLRSEFPGLDAVEACDAASLRSSLAYRTFDLAVLEHHPAWCDALEAFFRIRAASPECPCILFACDGDEGMAVEALRAGFEDCITKSSRNLPRLGASARRAIARARERRHGRELESRLEDLLSRLNVGVCRALPDGTLLDANPAFRRLLGCPDAPAALPSLRELLNAPFPALAEASAAPGGGMPHLFETRIEAPGGGIRWLSVSISAGPLPPTAEGSIGGPAAAEMIAVIMAEDITERKSLGARLHQQGDTLRQFQNLESIGRLAGGVAHDFNNMLTAINGYSELMLSSLEEGHPMRGPLSEIQRAGTRAALLTRDLLAFSGRQMLQASRLDLNEVVAGLAPGIRHALGDGIRLELELHPDPLPIYCDGGQVERALMNLVANSRAAMPKGGLLMLATSAGRIGEGTEGPGTGTRPGMRPSRPLAAGEYAIVSLADTGVGMDAGMLARIFEPFPDGPMDARAGIGLAATYGIVRQSGGEIAVESQPGQGTCFRIWIPRSEARRPSPPARP